MNLSAFDHLKDEARLWIYGFDKQLDDSEKQLVMKAFSEFVRTWHSHQAPVTGAVSLEFDQFILIAGYCEGGLSGCSIDGSTNVLKELRDSHGISALGGGSMIFFRDESGHIRSVDRPSFKKLVESGKIYGKTVVFDLTLQTVGALRFSNFEAMHKDCWHSRAFTAPGDAYGFLN